MSEDRTIRTTLDALRDWEQGKTQPNRAVRAYLMVIARNPKAVTEALAVALGRAP